MKIKTLIFNKKEEIIRKFKIKLIKEDKKSNNVTLTAQNNDIDESFITAVIIRMRVPIKEGPYMRKHNMFIVLVKYFCSALTTSQFQISHAIQQPTNWTTLVVWLEMKTPQSNSKPCFRRSYVRRDRQWCLEKWWKRALLQLQVLLECRYYSRVGINFWTCKLWKLKHSLLTLGKNSTIQF